jgi:NADH dehydrogenase FAD-containing subunit
VPLLTGTEVAAIGGHGRVRDVELHNSVTNSRRTIAVDTIVFTGDWIPDHELARAAGIALDPRSKGPIVDESGQSSASGIYAAGNLVHPAETADIAALRGAAVGASLGRRLTGRVHSSPDAAIDIVVAAPLLWSSPARVTTSAASDRAKIPAGLILRTAEFRRRPTVVITQGDRPLARFRVRAAIPNRSLRVPIDWSALVRPDAGTVHIHLE